MSGCQHCYCATGNSTFLSQMYSDLSGSSWVMITQHFLETVHDYTHLPWWATIVTTVSLRLTITLPLAAYHPIIYARLGNLKPEMDAILKELKKETDRSVIMYEWDAKKLNYSSFPCLYQETVESARSEGQLPSIQSLSPPPLPDSSLGLHVSSTQKHGHDASCPDHCSDSPLVSEHWWIWFWIPNLTEVDHSLILPVFMALTNLAIIQIQVMSKVGPSSRLSNAMMNVLRVFCLVMVPVAAYAPADVALYWTVSSVYGLAQNLVLLSPSFRRFSRIPVTPHERPQPYRHIVNQIKKSSCGLFQ
ncbi:cytochrome c oxidase assembly protein COX18, mitochondrial-like [Daphnia pulicaria]|uniref:cytochrome c oxidase assembly protein COX18, mitochondrial-like n=1 Tax=Daphnia pulicaria TaxID=35523 RepID=UPI001EEC2850|nr:cytochrome c oxidase assembly protein COX18, mitochondrial-like [Daphnia pulicaria]